MNAPEAADRGLPMVPTPASAMTFGLRSTSKIRDLHWNRLAMVYVRLSLRERTAKYMAEDLGRGRDDQGEAVDV